jgi:hypothetical protein
MKQETKKKIVNAVIVIVVVAALFLAANWLVSNINIGELLKQLHGG